MANLRCARCERHSGCERLIENGRCYFKYLRFSSCCNLVVSADTRIQQDTIVFLYLQIQTTVTIRLLLFIDYLIDMITVLTTQSLIQTNGDDKYVSAGAVNIIVIYASPDSLLCSCTSQIGTVVTKTQSIRLFVGVAAVHPTPSEFAKIISLQSSRQSKNNGKIS